ncbi:MAG TPA: hypothetical protein VLA52_16790 [Thermohalobaculum sp.]|nr:hypothetical protein [Thermohalobaculum sp.]
MIIRRFLLGLVLAVGCFGGWPDSVAHADQIQLLDPNKITKKFETALQVMKERLDAEEPPKYMLFKAELTYSQSNGLDGKIAGKIPALIATAEVSGEYKDLTTTTEKVTYLPAATVPVNFDDLGILAYLTEIHEKLRAEIAEHRDFLPAFREREDEFVIQIDGTGKLTFLALASIEGALGVKNVHKFKFYFCLVGNDGRCVGG